MRPPKPPPAEQLDFSLLNNYQHDFPLCPAPFAEIAAALGSDERTVLDAYRRLQASGQISRLGAVFAPRRIGASTLAAIEVPADRLATVAALVSRFPGVNHNYEREHRMNLWFVATASSPARLAATLAEIEAACRLRILRLPLEEEYHIDLGFALDRVHGRPLAPQAAPPSLVRPPRAELALRKGAPLLLEGADQALVSALQEGLALQPRPYAGIAVKLRLPESAIVERIRAWLNCGILKRFGVVVRHRELGFTANAMLVHDVPDPQVGEIGRRLGLDPAVTLCYRRPRVLPEWPYNLFCMVHGRERDAVEAQIAELRRRYGLSDKPHAVLFSRTRFKQQGARYAESGVNTHAQPTQFA